MKKGEIEVQCKKCGKWFKPQNRDRLMARIYQLESKLGKDGAYFYCSEECKNICPLYGLNPAFELNRMNQKELPYTPGEYNTFKQHVLSRDNYECQYCGEPAEHVHHERPQKLEPFFALDPDLAWSVCSYCHYEKGHKDECSTGQIANKVCST